MDSQLLPCFTYSASSSDTPPFSLENPKVSVKRRKFSLSRLALLVDWICKRHGLQRPVPDRSLGGPNGSGTLRGGPCSVPTLHLRGVVVPASLLTPPSSIYRLSRSRFPCAESLITLWFKFPASRLNNPAGLILDCGVGLDRLSQLELPTLVLSTISLQLGIDSEHSAE